MFPLPFCTNFANICKWSFTSACLFHSVVISHKFILLLPQIGLAEAHCRLYPSPCQTDRGCSVNARHLDPADSGSWRIS